jgi:hypothetical protein
MPVLESGNIFKKNFNKDSNPPITSFEGGLL